MSEEIVIEKNIDIPPPARRIKYPWGELELGDSFLVKDVKPTSVYGLIGQANRKYTPKKFAARAIDDGTRIWRVE